MGRAVLGVDLGGTNLRAAVLTHDGEILSKHKEATHAVTVKLPSWYGSLKASGNSARRRFNRVTKSRP